jgi:hypothetical protein
MAEIVLRLRLLGGEHLDVIYEEADTVDPDAVTEHAIATLGQDGGARRARQRRPACRAVRPRRCRPRSGAKRRGGVMGRRCREHPTASRQLDTCDSKPTTPSPATVTSCLPLARAQPLIDTN